MTTLRSLFALGATAALVLAPTPSYADDPAFIAGKHVDAGLHLQIDGYGRYGTFTYAALSSDGAAVTAYCLDLDTEYRHGSALYETGWAGAPAVAAHAEHVNWLLHQSHPFVPVDGIWPGAGFNDGLSVSEAVAATQAAVWHYTNGITITVDDVIGTPAEQQDVLALYRHLTGPANVGASEVPIGTLSITSDGRGGRAGERIGPLTVDTTSPATLTIEDPPPGVQLVDAEGVAVEGAVGSGPVYLEIPAGTLAGVVTINASATTTAPTGRIFMPVKGDPESATQPLVAAMLTNHPLLATITIPWQAAPQLATEARDDADGEKQVLPGGLVQDTVAAPPKPEGPPEDTEPAPEVTTEQSSPGPASPAPDVETVPDEPAAQGEPAEPAVSEPEPAEPTPPEPERPAVEAAAATKTSPPATITEPQQLADTGADVGRWALLAGSALLVGTGAMLLARRTR